MLNGPLAPIGWRIGVVEAPLGDVVGEVTQWRRGFGEGISTQHVNDAYPYCLHWLEPLERPASRDLFIEHLGRWTVFLSNHLDGGDPAATAGRLSPHLGVRAMAVSFQPLLHGGAVSEFQLFDRFGPPPLHLIRSLAVRAEAGVWSWHVTGAAQPFENPTLYEREAITDRLDRETLITYLHELGIEIDRVDAYGAAVLLTQVGEWTRHTMTLDQARANLDMA